MNEDFYYAFLTGWFILLIFWSIIILFIFIRKPPKSKLSPKIFYFSILIFFISLLIVIFIFRAPIRFM